MTAERGTCLVCGRPVLPTETAAYPVRGWEVERPGGGGANRILRREREDGIAHKVCVQHGQRDSLFGEET